MNRKYHDVLALNRSFIPIHIVDYKNALKNLVKGTVRALDRDFVAYDFEDWLIFSNLIEDFRFVRTVKYRVAVPEIIVEKNFNKIPMRDVKYTRQTLFERDGFSCAYCGKTFSRRSLTIDHILPRARGGKTTWQNTITCCRECNSFKANRTLEECGLVLRKKPKKPSWISPIVKIRPDHPCKSWHKFLDRALVDMGEG